MLISFDLSNHSCAIDVIGDGSDHEEKSYFKTLAPYFSSKLDWRPYIASLLKLPPRTLESLFIL